MILYGQFCANEPRPPQETTSSRWRDVGTDKSEKKVDEKLAGLVLVDPPICT